MGTSHGMLGTVPIVAISPPSYGVPSRLLGHDGKLSSPSWSSSSSFCLALLTTAAAVARQAGDEMMMMMMMTTTMI